MIGYAGLLAILWFSAKATAPGLLLYLKKGGGAEQGGAERYTEEISLTSAKGTPGGMVTVPGGIFVMGSPLDDKWRDPYEPENLEVEVPVFSIDRYEYPNIVGELPRVNFSWFEAVDRCGRAGKRLCTEEEWEKACRGPENSAFPYGDSHVPEKCNFGYGSKANWRIQRAGNTKFAECVSGYGVYDMSGNVAEYTSSTRSHHTGETLPLIRGGNWGEDAADARCANRDNFRRAAARHWDVGFRCCNDISQSREDTPDSTLSEDGVLSG